MSKIIKEALIDASKKIKFSETETSQLDAEVLLMHVLGKSREWILSHPRTFLNEKSFLAYQELVEMRSKNEPVAYIIGQKNFFGLDFQVNEDTLIPRPETELLILHTITKINKLKNYKNIILVDVGTGCGNIIICLAKLENILQNTNKKFVFYAVDNSIKALEIAKQNAVNHDVNEKVNFLRGRFLNPLIENPQLLQKLSSNVNGSNHNPKVFILANRPYLSKNIYNSTPDSVRLFEPKDALLSGVDGLDHYRKLLNQIKTLNELYRFSITVLLEISPEQKTLITREIKTHFSKVKLSIEPDLARKNRVVIFDV